MRPFYLFLLIYLFRPTLPPSFASKNKNSSEIWYYYKWENNLKIYKFLKHIESRQFYSLYVNVWIALTSIRRTLKTEKRQTCTFYMKRTKRVEDRITTLLKEPPWALLISSRTICLCLKITTFNDTLFLYLPFQKEK